jgi:hypothetical protein
VVAGSGNSEPSRDIDDLYKMNPYEKNRNFLNNWVEVKVISIMHVFSQTITSTFCDIVHCRYF